MILDPQQHVQHDVRQRAAVSPSRHLAVAEALADVPRPVRRRRRRGVSLRLAAWATGRAVGA